MIFFSRVTITLLLILSLLLGVTATVSAQEGAELSAMEALLQNITSIINNLAKQVANIAPASQTAAVGTSNLVAYYSFNEGSGTIANDTSGNNNDGTINGATWTSGISGNALSFDGVDDFVEMVSNSDLSIASDSHTISVWVRPSDVSGEQTILMRPGYELYLRAGNGALTYTPTPAASAHHRPSSNRNFTTGQWKHIVIVYDKSSGDITFYADGVQSGSDLERDKNSLNTNKELYLGTYASSKDFFSGSFDELRIYSRALSQSEVTDLYNDPGQNGGSAPTPDPTPTPNPTPDPDQTPGDNTPPVISNGSPTGTLSSNTTHVTLRINTDENAVCKYSTSAAASYFSMNSYSSTGGTTHTANTTVQPNQSYTYYTKCQDTNSNTSGNYTTSFSIPASAPTPTPNPSPTTQNWCTAGDSVLAQTIKGMQPNSWVEIPQNQSLDDLALTYSTFHWDDSAVWNPLTRNIQMVVSRGSCCGEPRYQLFNYDIDTNRWSIQDTDFIDAGHGYDGNALDPRTGKHYFARYWHGYIYFWDGQNWTALPKSPWERSFMGATPSLTWFEGLQNGNGALVLVSGHKVAWFNGNEWEILERSGDNWGSYTIFSQYSKKHDVIWLGGGQLSKVTYTLDNNLNFKRMNDAPLGFSAGKTYQSVDPVSGNFIVVEKATAKWWEFDPVSDVWTNITNIMSGTKPDYVRRYGFHVPIPECGGIMYFEHFWTIRKAYFYKHSDGLPDLDPTPNPTPTSQPSDITAPVLSGGTPDGTLPAGTSDTVMRVTTNENASCRYSTNSGTNYNSMTPYSTTGGTNHSVTVNNLQNGNSYSYYTKCRDNANNVSNDYAISFSLLAPVVTPTPNPTPNPTVIPALDLTFDEKCEQDGVLVCHKFTDQASVDQYYSRAYHVGTTPAIFDPVFNGAKLTIEPHTSHNTTGTFLFHHDPIQEGDSGNDQYWLQYKVRIPQDYLDNEEAASKIGVVYHEASCSGNEFAMNISGNYTTPTYTKRPSYYETCGANGYNVRNPEGLGSGRYDMQPGGGSSCLRLGGSLSGRPCFTFKGDTWTTFTNHIDFANSMAHVWAQHEGEEPVKIIEYPLQTIDTISSVFLGAYMNGRDASLDKPTYHRWYQDIIISNRPIDIGTDIVATGPPVPQPSPTPTSKFNSNENIQVTGDGTLNVRATANGTVLGQQTNGRVGTVIGGPTESGGTTWYQINFTEGVDGWVSEDFIEAYSGTLPSPTPAPSPNPTPQPTPSPPPPPPPPTSGGGTNTGSTVSGGGVVTPTTGGGNIQRYEFTRNLRIGSRGDDVKQLQKFLNDRGYTISTTGIGSRGNESSYFGQKTAEALKKFQDDHKADVLTPHNLTRGNGYFGASTRSKVNELYTTTPSTNGVVTTPNIDTSNQSNEELQALINSLLEQVQALTAQLNQQLGNTSTTITPSTTRFTRTLRLGSRGEDVRRLQQYLNSDPATQIQGTTGGSPGRETAYFGKKTEEALKRYQAKHGIVSSGTPSTTGYGVLGPKTRAKVNR